MIHTLSQDQLIPATLERVWAYFATPANLNEMTPPDLKFQSVGEPAVPMRTGQLITYRIRLMPAIWTSWLTEIRDVQEGVGFVDEQRVGPYKFWHHEHRFSSVPGGVRMTDLVTYDIGYGPIGELLHPLWIRPKLERIFAFRRAKVHELFGQSTGTLTV
jgi:ligand-binding SRPBCC domain-containing protein